MFPCGVVSLAERARMSYLISLGLLTVPDEDAFVAAICGHSDPVPPYVQGVIQTADGDRARVALEALLDIVAQPFGGELASTRWTVSGGFRFESPMGFRRTPIEFQNRGHIAEFYRGDPAVHLFWKWIPLIPQISIIGSFCMCDIAPGDDLQAYQRLNTVFA